MYIQVMRFDGEEYTFTDYTTIRNISFTPEVDLTGTSTPANEFALDVVTTDEIVVGDYVTLIDDLENEWAAYRVDSAVPIAPDVTHIVARSKVARLDAVKMEAVMCEAKPLADILDEIFGLNGYSLDSRLDGATVTGFLPEQTARERLTWVCFSVGAYVKMAFLDDSTVRIEMIDDTTTMIPLEKTFWRPTINGQDIVTGVKVTAFTFTEASSQEEWEDDDSSYRFPMPWVASEQEMSLTNPDAPGYAPENIVEVSEMYLINAANASAILSRMAAYYFKSRSVQLDCINNREYLPGQKVIAYTAEDALVTGFIRSANFSFGVQARSTLEIVAADVVEGAKLTVNYMYQGGKIGSASYFLPVGYAFSIQNPYIDRTYNGRRFIYGPQTEAATGTIASGGTTVSVDYDLALMQKKNDLYVYSVDDVTKNTSGETPVAVID